MGKSLAELLAQSLDRVKVDRGALNDVEKIRAQYNNLCMFVLAEIPDNTERDECVRQLVNSMSAAVRARLLKDK